MRMPVTETSCQFWMTQRNVISSLTGNSKDCSRTPQQLRNKGRCPDTQLYTVKNKNHNAWHSTMRNHHCQNVHCFCLLCGASLVLMLISLQGSHHFAVICQPKVRSPEPAKTLYSVRQKAHRFQDIYQPKVLNQKNTQACFPPMDSATCRLCCHHLKLPILHTRAACPYTSCCCIQH